MSRDDKQEKQRSSRDRSLTPNRDIGPLLAGWDYEPGTLNVRKIIGVDGKPKLQMRLDLGLLQMEMTGRPDGVQPHGCESLLDYFEHLLGDHRERTGDEAGFHLTPQQCQQLREEAVMYYHRYLSLFVLGEFDGVVRDTDRNLRVLDMCGQFAVDERDRVVLEQYRPYILMMNARATASIYFRDKRYEEALAAVKKGLRKIKRFFRGIGQEEDFRRSGEAKVLKRFARDINKHIPQDPIVVLTRQLKKAVEAEDYELAAKLRDQISGMQAKAE
jgi:hypothetical protein